MEKVSKQQIFCKLCSSFLLPFILVLVLFSFSYFFSVFDSLLTTLVALFTTMFLVTLTRAKWSLDEKNLVQDDNLKNFESSHPLLGDVITHSDDDDDDDDDDDEVTTENEICNYTIKDSSIEINADDEKYEHEQHADPDSGSQSTSSFENDQERSENHGMISNSLSYDSDIDVDDDDDDEEEEEDSLIEIKLPNRYLFEEPKQKIESNLPELFLPEYMFKQKGLMELLEEINEINEDENLIEIDISVGSTKCQDFRVKKELAYYGGDQCVHSDDC